MSNNTTIDFRLDVTYQQARERVSSFDAETDVLLGRIEQLRSVAQQKTAARDELEIQALIGEAKDAQVRRARSEEEEALQAISMAEEEVKKRARARERLATALADVEANARKRAVESLKPQYLKQVAVLYESMTAVGKANARIRELWETIRDQSGGTGLSLPVFTKHQLQMFESESNGILAQYRKDAESIGVTLK